MARLLALLVLALFATLTALTQGCDLASADPVGAEGDDWWPDDVDEETDSWTAPITGGEAACGIVGTIACGDVITLDTATDSRATSELDTYFSTVGRWTGPELGFRFVAGGSGPVEVALVDPQPTVVNHDIFVLDRAGGPCDQEAVLAHAYNSGEFQAVAGDVYTVMVDAYDGDAGEFTLAVECDLGGDGDVPADPGDPDLDCADGTAGCVDSFPFFDQDTTQTAPGRSWHAYGCNPALNESGPERIYEVVVPEGGYLAAVVTDGPGVDVDVHLLDALDPDACLDRGDSEAWAFVEPGRYYVVADTYGGDHNAGDYELQVGLTVPSYGDCAMEHGWMARTGADELLSMPARGLVVKEAHLVSIIDGFGLYGEGPWPDDGTDGLDVHVFNTVGTTGMVMDRTEPWAWEPGGEPGRGANWDKLPPDAECWYVNMYWADRPPAGTRMIVQANGRAVVAAAGYETGPGNLDHIGGVTEEIHRYLDTVHISEMTLGFALDQDLPLGPITCY